MSDSIAQRNRGPEWEVDLGNIFECLNGESSDNESETRTKTSQNVQYLFREICDLPDNI